MNKEIFVDEEKKLLEQQLLTTAIFVISLFISMYLTYNDLLKLDEEEKYCGDETYNKVAISNRVLILLLSLSYLYINYENKKIAQARDEDTTYPNLQIMAGELSIIAAIIVLYVVIETGAYTIIGVANPTL